MRKEWIIRYIIFFAIIALSVTAAAAARGARVKTAEIRLFFVDAEMLRLIPVNMTVPDVSTERMAQRVLDELIKGRDDNPKIRRIIPDARRCMTVRVKNETAYVDLKKEMRENHPDGRDLEVLTIYSIVNSLTDIDGIKTVRFTIEGRLQKNFMGYIDMRETFVPDYFV